MRSAILLKTEKRGRECDRDMDLYIGWRTLTSTMTVRRQSFPRKCRPLNMEEHLSDIKAEYRHETGSTLSLRDGNL